MILETLLAFGAFIGWCFVVTFILYWLVNWLARATDDS